MYVEYRSMYKSWKHTMAVIFALKRNRLITDAYHVEEESLTIDQIRYDKKLRAAGKKPGSRGGSYHERIDQEIRNGSTL